ncbi:hypothetical protein [uncultured Sneathiella sp.]|uniref:hypothetical protein n=1 Tax=uncultured Sneathiella sp. TaxID=879315 RepID=UPI0030D8141E|tara:strand:+ start:6933 stop:7934 length:1002 start_codon:yes stop_codon:yes gene_type:complete
MNNLVPFAKPTFYSPGQNALNMGARKPVRTPSGVKFYTPPTTRNALNPNNLQPIGSNNLTTSQNALTRAFYDRDLGGQSPGDTPGTGGDPNQGAGESVPAAQMSTQDLADEIGQLDAMNDVVSVGKGLGLSFGPVGLFAGLYSAGKNKLDNRPELEKRNDLMAPEDEVSPTEFSFDPQMSDQQIADQNKEMQRSVTGTDQGISRNDPNPAPSGDSNAGQGDTIICSELFRQGIMPRYIWEADERFGDTLDETTLQGYHAWAGPWVRVMQRSPLATRLTWLVARPWAYHMAFKMNAVEEDNAIGRLLMSIGIPLCNLIGKKIAQKEPSSRLILE